MNEHDIQTEDREFFAKLCAWLNKAAIEAGGSGAIVFPLFFMSGGLIDREKTLALPCYEGINA